MPIFLAFLVLFSAGISQAQARNYAVEMIVFQRTNAEAPGESVPVSRETIARKQLHIEALAAKSKSRPSSGQLFQLGRIQQDLIRSGYRVLRTARWVQGRHVYHRAPVMSIGQAGSPLSAGFVRVYRTSLIFVDLDLQLTLPASWSSSSAGTTQPINTVGDTEISSDINTEDAGLGNEPGNGLGSDQNGIIPSPSVPGLNQMDHFFISEKRRLKFKEVHYFDHPEFGVILGVWPS